MAQTRRKSLFWLESSWNGACMISVIWSSNCAINHSSSQKGSRAQGRGWFKGAFGLSCQATSRGRATLMSCTSILIWMPGASNGHCMRYTLTCTLNFLYGLQYRSMVIMILTYVCTPAWCSLTAEYVRQAPPASDHPGHDEPRARDLPWSQDGLDDRVFPADPSLPFPNHS